MESVLIKLGRNFSEREPQGNMAPLCQSSVYGNTFIIRPSDSLTDINLDDILKIRFNQCVVK